MMILASFVITLLLMPKFIRLLQKKQIGQYVREEGPASHLSKQGTPTMGGLVFILVPSLLSIAFAWYNSLRYDLFWILYMVLSFSIIGFLDDYRKTSKKSSYGLKAREDLFLQIIFSIPFIWHIYVARTITAPIWIFFPFALFLILAITNSVNLTDGMDGLLSGITLLILFFYIAVSIIGIKNPVNPYLLLFFGSILAFLFFNFYPARVFMGNVGSFCIGGLLAYLALSTGTEWFVPILGGILVAEAMSDIIQVSYFKYTRKKTGTGKRIFKMAPIHHHFELSGIPEPTLVVRFWIFQLVLTVISLLLYYKYPLR
jgi:phospho-N-acetylmuramoyl-pentapeptide-transferase